MKNKKSFLPVLIPVVAIFAITVYAIISAIALKPTVTESEFPFAITYELDGETVTIRDVYKARYDHNGGYADTKSRIYVGEIGNMGEENTVYTLKEEADGHIELHTCFYADYLMGDPLYDYSGPFQPQIYYYDAEGQEYGDEETLAAHGVKLIDFEYPTPIENSFVFSHLSYFSGSVVIPALLISLLAMIAMIIFAKKEKDLQYKAIDVASIVLNFVIGLTLIPFISILAMFIDITGGNPEFYNQMLYFLPAFSVLCTAASIALRRKGHGVKSLIAALTIPVVFAVYLIVCTILDLL